MSKGAKIIIFVIFIFSLAATYFTFLTLQKMEAEKKQRVFVEGELKKTSQKLDRVEKEKQEVKVQLNEVIEVKEQISEERDKAKEEAYRLSLELEKEKREKKRLQEKLQEKQRSALELMKQLQEERAEKEKLGQKLNDLELASKGGSKQQNELLAKLQKAQEEKEALTKKLRAMSTPDAPVKIKDIIVQADQKFSGTVLTVNGAYNFVIIDIGAVDGIMKGTELIVHRGKKLIGKLKVEKVYDKMSAATIIPKWMQDEVKEDDSVKKF